MFEPTQYELLDCGAGRKLERFGSVVLDRPAPAAADTPRRNPAAWRQAIARFERAAGDNSRGEGSSNERGAWAHRDRLPESWRIRAGQVVLELKPTDFGHLGVFPEHAASWQWLAGQQQAAGRPVKVLNLFAYPGGATLALAAAGAEVVHVDAARSSVAWARRNAEHSGMAVAPIRWIVEDAQKFVARELKRGNRYDAVVLDPPSYGHGPQGEYWKLAEHLAELVHNCWALTGGSPRFMLLTCHTPGFERAEIEALVMSAAGRAHGRLSIEPLSLVSAAGGRLACGIEARWTSAAL
jgi:23S rRNA (cytosine1962-C5)-methyltransferase